MQKSDLGDSRARYWYQTEEGPICNGWTVDGMIFQAYRTEEHNTEPVYQFHFEGDAGWHNTLQMESTSLVSPVGQWVFDNVKFYAYKTSMGSEKLQQVHRYWYESYAGGHSRKFGRIYMLTIRMGIR